MLGLSLTWWGGGVGGPPPHTPPPRGGGGGGGAPPPHPPPPASRSVRHLAIEIGGFRKFALVHVLYALAIPWTFFECTVTAGA